MSKLFLIVSNILLAWAVFSSAFARQDGRIASVRVEFPADETVGVEIDSAAESEPRKPEVSAENVPLAVEDVKNLFAAMTNRESRIGERLPVYMRANSMMSQVRAMTSPECDEEIRRISDVQEFLVSDLLSFAYWDETEPACDNMPCWPDAVGICYVQCFDYPCVRQSTNLLMRIADHLGCGRVLSECGANADIWYERDRDGCELNGGNRETSLKLPSGSVSHARRVRSQYQCRRRYNYFLKASRHIALKSFHDKVNAMFSRLSEQERRYWWWEFARRAKASREELARVGEGPCPRGIMKIDLSLQADAVENEIVKRGNDAMKYHDLSFILDKMDHSHPKSKYASEDLGDYARTVRIQQCIVSNLLAHSYVCVTNSGNKIDVPWCIGMHYNACSTFDIVQRSPKLLMRIADHLGSAVILSPPGDVSVDSRHSFSDYNKCIHMARHSAVESFYVELAYAFYDYPDSERRGFWEEFARRAKVTEEERRSLPPWPTEGTES